MGYCWILPGRRGWHFPRTGQGAYLGHHPATSTEAIEYLERLRAEGAEYLLIPAPSFWWLEHYKDFSQHLDRSYRQVAKADGVCLIYGLEPASALPRRQPSGGAVGAQPAISVGCVAAANPP